MNRLNFRCASFLIALGLSACATAPQPQVWPWPDEPYSGGANEGASSGAREWESPTKAPSDSQNPYGGSNQVRSRGEQSLYASSAVAQQLVDEARSLRNQGRYAEAYRQLERGVSIAPRDAVLWFELARVRLAEERWDDAENLAQRALEYAQPGDDVSAYCWELIARSREGRGDYDGAEQARRMGQVRS